uniref:Reverse transcriptase zinc-binding domain-containing protein n=1 Tax=Fagus sylvatica TaxID=28930 RepID=A0A2N9FZ97_FAGSY
MGFRDLQFFNQALLAKQGWRILTSPDTLLHKVLKCKYFPNCSFMEATIPSHSSYMWRRSIAQSRDITRRGSRWRIGDGTRVKIWQDRWIRGTTSGRVITAPSHLPPDANVVTLIDHDSHCWKDNLVDFLFTPSEVALIKSIPLPSLMSNDLLIWSRTTKGQQTAKSAYHFLWEEQANLPSIPSSSSSTGLWLFWKSLWAVNVPNKIKTFAWKACSNILPTFMNLWKKEIVATVSCYLCGDEAETIGHVLWLCPFTESIWRSTPLFSKLPIDCIMDFQDVMDSALTNLPSPDIEMFITLAWLIWKTRNEVWQGKPIPSNPNLFLQAAAYSAEFIERSQPMTTKIGSSLPQHWDRPEEGFYKVNVAIKSFNDELVGIGVLIRDWNEEVSAALSERQSVMGDGLWRYALAVWRALNFCLEVGYHSIHVECSNPSLPSLLKCEAKCVTEVGWVVQDIKALFSLLNSLSFRAIQKFVIRQLLA